MNGGDLGRAERRVTNDPQARLEQARLIYDGTGLSVSASLLFLGFGGLVLQNGATPFELAFWGGVIVIVILARGLLYLAFLWGTPTADAITPWLHAITGVLFITGVVIGLATYFLFDGQDAAHRNLATMTVMVYLGGAMTTTFAFRRCYLALAMPLLLLLYLRLIQYDDDISLLVSLVPVIFAVFSLVAVNRLNRMLLQNLNLRFGQSRLTDQLRNQKERAEQLNQSLSAENAVRQQTEHRLAESIQRFRDYAKAANDLFWETDQQMRIVKLDGRGADMNGDGQWTMMVGQDLRQLWRRDDDPENRLAQRRLIDEVAARNPFRGLTLPLADTDPPRMVTLGGVPVRDAGGRFLGYRGTATDVSELHQALDRIRRALDEVTIANQAKSEFLATISHEIRTPINGIIGMAGLLRDTPLDDSQGVQVKVIRESGETLLSVINDVLDFSRLETGNLELETGAFKPIDLVEDVLDLLAPQARGKGLNLTNVISPAADGVYVGDAGRVRQILLNLTANGVKFTEAGTVAVEVVHEGVRNGRDLLRFMVRDTGIGIAASMAEKLFAGFSQIEGFDARRQGGLGLGLAICHKLTEAMGGQIGFDSTEGAGSTFWFTLPLARDRDRRPQPSQDLFQHFNGFRVLVVDGEPLNAECTRRTLEAWGMDCVLSRDGGKIAIGPDDATPPDVVLIDCLEPGPVEGDLVEAIRASPMFGQVPIVVSSHQPAVRWTETRLRAQVSAHMTKPVRRRLLKDTLSAVLLGTAMPALEPEEGQTAAGSLRVLVVDDNPVNQHVARCLLEKMGHHVDLAGNGMEAVEAVRNLPYDLVFMDLQMPEMDGLEATRAIRALSGPEARIPIYAVTGNPLASYREACLAIGMNGFINKPVDRQGLDAAIAAIRDGPLEAE